MDSLADDMPLLLTLVTIAETGSFAAAAQELGIGRSAVSKQIARLEARHGVRLIERSTAGLRFTEAGLHFQSHCAEVVRRARVAFEELAENRAEVVGLLRVAAPIGIGERMLAGHLAAFLDEHPRLRAELVLQDERVDLLAENFDLAVRVGAAGSSSRFARRIGWVQLVVVASPAYLEASGGPAAPDDLPDHPWAGFSILGDPQVLTLSRAEERVEVSLRGRLMSNNGAVLKQTVMAGRAITLLPRFYVAEELADGRLVEVLPAWSVPRIPIWLVRISRGSAPAKIREFIHFLERRLQAESSRPG